MFDNLSGQREIDLTQIRVEDIPNIDDIDVDMNLPVVDKVELLLEHSGNNPFLHENEGYIVSVKTTEEIDTTDAILHYLRQRAKLRYSSA